MDSYLFKQDQPKKNSLDSPLADRMRPSNLSEILGQDHLLGEHKFLKKVIEKGDIPSLVFWGPPGSGKTTLAYLLSSRTQYPFVIFSAVTSGIQEIKKMLKDLPNGASKMILFIDEIHRFNKLQQDVFLPYIENGSIVLIGATTENPSFELNSALLSRLKVVVLHPLKDKDIRLIIERALTDKQRGLGLLNIEISESAMNLLISYASGDGRIALNVLEIAVNSLMDHQKRIEDEQLMAILQKKIYRYDKAGEQHFDLISALHKSLRGSDGDAALYYMLFMLDSGEDPLYIARRLVRFAAEDIGLADPFALVLAQSVFQSCSVIGYPECDCILGELVLYLALSPKSNSSYKAVNQVRKVIQQNPYEDVPLVIRNAPTNLMKELGYSDGYIYPPDTQEGIVSMDYLPDRLKGSIFYEPGKNGKEEYYQKRIQLLREKLGKK